MQPPRPGEHYDVLILGAGWGGLTAASLLAKAGRRIAVLEARDRAGGRGQSAWSVRACGSSSSCRASP